MVKIDGILGKFQIIYHWAFYPGSLIRNFSFSFQFKDFCFNFFQKLFIPESRIVYITTRAKRQHIYA